MKASWIWHAFGTIFAGPTDTTPAGIRPTTSTVFLATSRGADGCAMGKHNFENMNMNVIEYKYVIEKKNH